MISKFKMVAIIKCRAQETSGLRAESIKNGYEKWAEGVSKLTMANGMLWACHGDGPSPS